MKSENSLNNQLLIAMPGMNDPNFHSTVTLICEHNDEGALGMRMKASVIAALTVRWLRATWFPAHCLSGL